MNRQSQDQGLSPHPDPGRDLVHILQKALQDRGQDRDHLREVVQDQDLAAVVDVIENADHIPNRDHLVLITTEEGMLQYFLIKQHLSVRIMINEEIKSWELD